MRPDHDHAVDPADVVDHHRRQLRNKNPATTAVNTHASRTPRSHGPSAAHLQRPVIPPARNVREHSSQHPSVDLRRDRQPITITKPEPEPNKTPIHTAEPALHITPRPAGRHRPGPPQSPSHPRNLAATSQPTHPVTGRQSMPVNAPVCLAAKRAAPSMCHLSNYPAPSARTICPRSRRRS